MAMDQVAAQLGSMACPHLPIPSIAGMRVPTAQKTRRNFLSVTVPASERTDALVRAVAENRDRAAFAELFQTFAPRVKAFLLRLGVSNAEAEELTQDVFLSVWRKAHLFNPQRASSSTWIFTIARNVRIDWARRLRDPKSLTDPVAFHTSADEPHTQLTARQTEDAVRTALGDLPPDQLDVIRLSFLEDRSHQDIAEYLGIPLGTVKSRLRLAFAKLRLALDGRV